MTPTINQLYVVLPADDFAFLVLFVLVLGWIGAEIAAKFMGRS